MNSKLLNTETEVRSLLEQYYDGGLTPEATVALLRKLESLEPLPADLESDLELLRLLSAAEMETARIEVPDDLEDKLRRDIRRRSASSRRRLRIRMIGWGAAASVMLALTATFVARVDSTVDLSGSQTVALTADSDTATMLIRPVKTQIAATSAPAVALQPVAEEVSAPSQERRRRVATTANSSRRIQSAAEYTTRHSDRELSAADRETLREAFGSFRQVAEDVSRDLRQDLGAASTEITASMAEMNTEMKYISSSSNSTSHNTSDILLQP